MAGRVLTGWRFGMVAWVICATVPVWAQPETPLEAIPDAVTSDLRFTVDRMATSGRLPEAIPYLEELVRRFEATKGARYEQELERFYFLLGAAMIQVEQYEDAVDWLEKYTRKFAKAVDAPTAWEWLGDCRRLNDDAAGAAEAYQRLRTGYNLRPVLLEPVVAKEASVLAELERWEEATPLLTRLLEQARDPALRGQAATLLVRAHLALDEVDRIVALIPQLLSVSQSRHDVDFNILLIQGGDTKYHAGDPDNALLLYQLALTKEELLAWHDAEILRLEDALDARAMALDFRAATGLRTRLKDLRAAREDIQRRDSFTEELLFRKGQAAFEAGRKWEAFWTFWSIWKTLPVSESSRQALYSAFVLAGELNMDARALEFGTAFVETFGPGDFFDEVTLQMANLHLRRRAFAEALAASEQARALNPEHAYLDRLLFIAGYSQFQLGQLGEALAVFNQVRIDHPDSASEEGAIYWIGMTHLFRQEYESARDEFSEFTARYIGGIYFEDARFRLGVAEYGLGELAAAREHFERFVAEFPSSLLRSEAHAFLGDIAGAEGRLDDAVAAFRLVPDYTDQLTQINYAAFQIGKILELQQRYAELAGHFNDYLQTYRLDGQYTEALHRIGFARKMQGDVDGMLRTYEDAVRRYAHRVDALGIDLILRDWIAAYETVHGARPVEALRDGLVRAERENQPPARLRYQWALAELCGEPAEGAVAEADLKHASPAVLTWVGRDPATAPALALTALEKAVEEFPGSPWAEEALAAWAERVAAAGDRARALALYERLFNDYPTGPRAGEALVRIADYKAALGRVDEAVADYLRVLEMREWRGPLWPEALLRIGEALAGQGKLQEAFGYFQRVYVLYGGYPEWAARAYLQSGLVLERLNRRREAIDTYREFLSNETLRAQPPAAEAEQRMNALL